jgi:hypothetical protein
MMKNQKNSEQKDFQVALLMDDITEAKVLSEAFRELGIYAHFYQNLDEYWVDINTQTPNLTIVDVKKMSEGELLFENHPKVKSGNLCFSFFYKEETKMLLNSTYNLNHFGLIKKEISIGGQIISLLRRRNTELSLIDQNIELATKLDRVQKRTHALSEIAQKSQQFENQVELMNQFFNRLGSAISSKDFLRNLSSTFNEWENCLAFGIYQLSKNSQKLSSIEKRGPKFKALPDLWLTTPCNEGIKGYAKEMAEDISRDYLLSAARSIEIKGQFVNADILILANFEETSLNAFDWNLFSERLSNLYRMSKINELTVEKDQKEMDAFEAMSFLDDLYFHQAQSKHKVINLDLSPLLNLLKEKHSNRFYWKSFIQDFKEELTRNLSGDFRFSLYGAQSILLFVDRENLDRDFQTLKHFISDFPYFKFFEDSSLVMSNSDKPELMSLTPSSTNFLRQMETKHLLKTKEIRPSSTSPVFNI